MVSASFNVLHFLLFPHSLFHFYFISYIDFLINRFLGCCFPPASHGGVCGSPLTLLSCTEGSVLRKTAVGITLLQENPYIWALVAQVVEGDVCLRHLFVKKKNKKNQNCSHTSEMCAKEMELQARRRLCVAVCVYECLWGWVSVNVCVCVCLGDWV